MSGTTDGLGAKIAELHALQDERRAIAHRWIESGVPMTAEESERYHEVNDRANILRAEVDAGLLA